ncbi:hypothetical protein H1P_2760008 [Hyella patelloides LEGE 07179]|uniref:Uncharacterized protein n=1 Tax=Hyella patelloides LEGE 07179 TaxID=945734 RepID=A0A563VT82_9CYAN|nr:hypothetical protein H1P_2760008 [Hyella patelloides LEGE 07179]
MLSVSLIGLLIIKLKLKSKKPDSFYYKKKFFCRELSYKNSSLHWSL